MSPVSWTRLGRRDKHQGPCTPQGKTQLSIPWTTVCMLTIEQPSTSSSGKEHAHLCVCVLWLQVLPSSAPHPSQPTVPLPPPEETLGHNSFSESDKSALSVNSSNKLLLCSNYPSANTQHLAGRDCTPRRAFLGAAESCFGSSERELGKHGPKISNLNHDLTGTKAYVPQKEGESGMAENSKASIPSAGGNQREAPQTVLATCLARNIQGCQYPLLSLQCPKEFEQRLVWGLRIFTATVIRLYIRRVLERGEMLGLTLTPWVCVVGRDGQWIHVLQNANSCTED